MIKSCIIGLGRIASLLEEDVLREKPATHAGAFSANSECELAAGCDIDEKRRRLFADKWKVPVYKDAAEMIRIHKPQIVSVATHPDSHYYYCNLASKEGVPVIICEKPLSDNYENAKKIAALEKKGTKIITNHERRYSKDYILAKKILNKGKLGNLLSIRACLYMGKTRRLLSVLWHDGTHLLDIIMFLTDGILKHKNHFGAKLESKQGTAWLEGLIKQEHQKNNKAVSTKKSLDIKFDNIPVLIEVGAQRNHLVFEIEFSCEKGRLRIGNGVFEVYLATPSPYAQNFYSLKKTDDVFTGNTGYFQNMIQDAAACVKDPKHKPASSASDGLRVIEYFNKLTVSN